jgi:hypothetical protein
MFNNNLTACLINYDAKVNNCEVLCNTIYVVFLFYVVYQAPDKKRNSCPDRELLPRSTLIAGKLRTKS